MAKSIVSTAFRGFSPWRQVPKNNAALSGFLLGAKKRTATASATKDRLKFARLDKMIDKNGVLAQKWHNRAQQGTIRQRFLDARFNPLYYYCSMMKMRIEKSAKKSAEGLTNKTRCVIIEVG